MINVSYLCLLSGAETLVLEFVVVHAVVDLETEEVIEDTIGRRDDDVPILEFLLVVVCVLWLILDHIVVHRFEDVTELFELLQPPLLLKDLQLLIPWQDRELVWDVERVLLLI